MFLIYANTEKEIVSVQWIDRDTQKEKKQIVSDEWAGLKIKTGNFEKGDEIKITIKEVNGKLLEKGKSAIESSEKAGSDDVLIIKKAFKFSKAETNINREVSVTVSSAEASKSGENTLKENNGGIWGISASDANKMKDDIYKVLANNKFADVRALIMTEGKTFKKVNNNELSSALAGKQLNSDETAYINMVVNTINSEAIFKIEYLNYSGTTSAEGANRINHYFATQGLSSIMTPAGTVLAATIVILVGEGLNIPTENGSHSFVISGMPNITTERAITSGHELFGHGIPSSRRESDTTNNANAIRTDNLIRRLLGLPQRDGADHGGYKEGHIINPYILPLML